MIFQAGLVLAFGLVLFYLYRNLQSNLEKQNIASGFLFLSKEAGFEISEKAIFYNSYSTYLRALGVGLANTFKIAILGNVLAIFLGVVVGVAARSSHFLVKKLSFLYIESARNFPLMLQLFFWYAIFSEIAPGVKEAWQPLPYLFVSNRGINFPVPEYHISLLLGFTSFVVGLFISFFTVRFYRKKRIETGREFNKAPILIVFLLVVPFVVFFISSFLIGEDSLIMSFPVLGRYNFENGAVVTPEFMALLLGLVFYTGAFNGEIVRAGIDSVKRGQWEAAKALGISGTKKLSLVILPQALRVIIPPMTSQILNLVKNSSLGVAIAYPDFVSVANTTLNQTGQAVEMIIIIMTVYLLMSLLISLIMNYYNKKMAIP